jgi:hypothetical protein
MKNEIKRSLGMLACILTLLVVFTVLGSVARAECFGSADQWVAVARSAKTALPSTQLKAIASTTAKVAQDDADNDDYKSIAGMWHVHYQGPFPGGDQEAFQIFNAGGTEVHNPKGDPRAGSLCLGAWVQKGRNVKLTHRVWLWDPFGTYIGLGDLEVNITLGDKGNTQTGTLTMQIFFPDGSSTPPLPGTLTGERIVPKQ